MILKSGPCRTCGVTSKVIIEAALLTDEEKITASTLSKAAGADFVKTSTGFASGGATAADPLKAYCQNLTERARRGLLDPLIGRADELQRTIEVLCRRRKNNPVYVGEAGVGKTAMAEGLATRLLGDDVPDLLADWVDTV